MLYFLIIFLIIVIIFLVSGCIFYMALNRNAKKDIVLESDLNNKKTKGKKIMPPPDVKWLKNNARQVNIISSDDIKLHGYIVNNNSNKWMILVHGYASDHTSMINRGKKFYRMGYNILLVDLRAHGNSDGKYITMGIKDSHDIDRWIKYIIRKEHAKEIGLFGISMGAATVMMTLGLNIDKEVKYAIEDCGYNSVWDELKYQLNNLFHLPAFPFLYISNFYAKIFAKFDFKSYTSEIALAKTDIPILMIHGTADTFVPYYMLDKNYNSCNSYAEKFIVEKANHTESEDLDYDNYWKTIKKFINKGAINGKK